MSEKQTNRQEQQQYNPEQDPTLQERRNIKEKIHLVGASGEDYGLAPEGLSTSPARVTQGGGRTRVPIAGLRAHNLAQLNDPPSEAELYAQHFGDHERKIYPRMYIRTEAKREPGKLAVPGAVYLLRLDKDGMTVNGVSREGKIIAANIEERYLDGLEVAQQEHFTFYYKEGDEVREQTLGGAVDRIELIEESVGGTRRLEQDLPQSPIGEDYANAYLRRNLAIPPTIMNNL